MKKYKIIRSFTPAANGILDCENSDLKYRYSFFIHNIYFARYSSIILPKINCYYLTTSLRKTLRGVIL